MKTRREFIESTFAGLVCSNAFIDKHNTLETQPCSHDDFSIGQKNNTFECSSHIPKEWIIPNKYHCEYYNKHWAETEPTCAAYIDLYCEFVASHFKKLKNDKYFAIQYLYKDLYHDNSIFHNEEDFITKSIYEFCVYGGFALDKNGYFYPLKDRYNEDFVVYAGTKIFDSSMNNDNIKDIFKEKYRFYTKPFNDIAKQNFELLANYTLSIWCNQIVSDYSEKNIYSDHLTLEPSISALFDLEKIQT